MPEMGVAGEVVQAHRFDIAALERYCAEAVPALRGRLAVSQIVGGSSNPTFVLQAQDGRRYVLRKKPPGKLLPSAHQVEREYRVMQALQGSGVPVPGMLALCEDAGVIGTPFYIMEYCEGRVFRDAQLPGCTPAERRAIYDSLNETLARLHQVDPRAVGLEDFGRQGNYFERQYSRWERQYRGAQTREIPEMEELVAMLPALLPADDSVAITHGDYRTENTMFHPHEPRALAVLDWELSTIGHPLADLGHICVQYHTRSPAFGTLAGIDHAALGIPTEQEFIAAYCRRTGRERIANFGFYVGFAMFRLASIAQGSEKRRLDGVNPRPKPPGADCVDWARHALAALRRG